MRSVSFNDMTRYVTISTLGLAADKRKALYLTFFSMDIVDIHRNWVDAYLILHVAILLIDSKFYHILALTQRKSH